MTPAIDETGLERRARSQARALQNSDRGRLLNLPRPLQEVIPGARVVYLRKQVRADPELIKTAEVDDEAVGPMVIRLKNVRQREIDIDPGVSESALARSLNQLRRPERLGLLPRESFATILHQEWDRHLRGGRDGAVASLVLAELDAVRLRLGNRPARQLLNDIADTIRLLGRPLDVIGLTGDSEISLLIPDLDATESFELLSDITDAIATTVYTVGHERVLLSPAAGFAMLSDTEKLADVVGASERARAVSMLNLDLRLERWRPDERYVDAIAELVVQTEDEPNKKTRKPLRERLRTPSQILLTYVIGWVVPFFAYFFFDRIGFDISWGVYLIVVMSLVMTGWFIIWEGLFAFDQREPPDEPEVAYPKATAIIAAYLPNEAATVIDTIDSFLELDYGNDIQIILAYNTPDPLPVEKHLDRLAARHRNFQPVKVEGSNSKAQNVNAVLPLVEGEFIGMFDADHQPRPDAFTRAWKWLDDGYDVVQGHCLTRNGDSNWLAKMIAVEFESIYAVAHPGRARMHRFGVFGGSNGFWRTELLHETRMRGSMLTEDIDSSLRVVERGFKIRSDPKLVSLELATTTFQQIWNQRMRWAQGWFQVAMIHAKLGLKSKHLTKRQKFGVFHLLIWREIYPWLSYQMFPLIAFWSIRAGGITNLDWTVQIFVATTVFTLCVGPLQAYFAYRLADPEIKQHKKWFWGYLLFTTPFYVEYKNLIARVAHIKELMGESDWRVTPRSAD